MSDDIDRLRKSAVPGKRVDLGRASPTDHDTVPTESMPPTLHEATARDAADLRLRRRVRTLERAINGTDDRPGLLRMGITTQNDVREVKTAVQLILYVVLVLLGCGATAVVAFITSNVIEVIGRLGNDRWIAVAAYGVVALACGYAAAGIARAVIKRRKEPVQQAR